MAQRFVAKHTALPFSVCSTLAVAHALPCLHVADAQSVILMM